MRFIDLGMLSFLAAQSRQNETLERISRGQAPETIYLLEHPHVFTLGRKGDLQNLLSTSGPEGRSVEVITTNRGGDVTYHGPGQLVGYPHLDLSRRGRKIDRYLRDLEGCLIETIREFGVQTFPRSGLTGVWSSEGKVASIGVGVRNWITMHGFALNVKTDLRYFDLIRPCGLEDCRMTSLEEILQSPVDMDQVKEVFKRHFVEQFNPQ